MTSEGAARPEVAEGEVETDGEFDACFPIPLTSRHGTRLRGRFRPALNDYELLDGVAAVARESGVADPARLSMRDWNRSKMQAGRFDLPVADTIRQRFRRPWRNVLECALAPLERRGLLLGRLRPGYEFTADVHVDVPRALKAIALRLGSAPTQMAYDLEVGRFHAERSRKCDVLSVRLPVSATVLDEYSSWDAALNAAGLQATRASAPIRRSRAYPFTDEQCVASVRRFLDKIEGTGTAPTVKNYQAVIAGDRECISFSSMQRRGWTWPRLLAAAYQK